MGCAQSQQQLTPEKIGQALKEALKIAAQTAVNTVSAKGGFNHPSIHIAIPGTLGDVCEKLKSLPGLDTKITEFEAAMNQAAEAAATEALPILLAAVDTLTFQDARAILDGPANAATDHFQKLTRTSLYEKFLPVIDAKMKDFNVTTVYEFLIEAYGKLPFCSSPEKQNLQEYITNKGLDGLFFNFAEEEKKIRGNPGAQTNDVVRDVFSQAGKKQQ